MNTKIACPHCHREFDVDEVLAQKAAHELEDKIRTELTAHYRSELATQQKKLHDQLASERDQITASLREQFAREQGELAAQLKASSAKIKSRDEQLEKMRADNLKFLQEKDAWELEKRNLALENQKALASERERIQSEVIERFQEEQKLKLAEKDKRIADVEAKLAEAQRKIAQGSQQMQGEVLELELEDELRQAFGDDLIEPIGKGVNGADIRQRVVNTRGVECGKIIWESKRTKNWTEGWIAKLKDDLRAEKGDLAVLVTTAMPKTIAGKFGFYQGIWLCQPELAVFVAQLLRFNLIRIGFVVDSQASKDEKVEALYRYLTGPEFTQKIEAQYETILAMREQLEKEKTFWKRHLAAREKQIESLQTEVVTLYGGLQGVTHNALPAVKLLEGE